MKNLLYKDFKLAAHPTTYIFLALCTMMLIPRYPGYAAFFYICLSIFFVFLTARENKDVFYTALLPVRKRDIVKARIYMVAIIEVVQIVLSVPFAILANKISPDHGNLAGIDANVAFFGLVFVMFTVFNIVFIPIFYRTAFKAGWAFLYGGVAVLLFYFAAELLIWIPSPARTFLDTISPDMMVKHLPILAGGIVVWLLGLLFTFRRSAANFEKVDI
jgi:hypothetical protein